jgi:hypothetical protein
MIETILTTVLSSNLTFLKPATASNSSTPQVVFTRVLPQENYVSYVVEKNDTLKSISLFYYGSEDNWTTLWNDNPWIGNPDNLTVGQMIKINMAKFSKPESLSDQLEQKENKLSQNSGTTEIKITDSISEAPLITAIPQITITPVPLITTTPIPTVTVTNTASTISDGAVTYLGSCEAGMDPAKNTGNGYYGAFQFSYGTWQGLNTGYARADLAPIAVQEAAVKQLLQRSSIYSQFPACAQRMHSAGLI